MLSYIEYKPDGIKEVQEELLWVYSKYIFNKHILEYRQKNNNTIMKSEYIFQNLLEQVIIVSNEVLYLIKGGYFDGSQARIRTLHEYCEIITFIKYSEDVEETANRYAFYNAVEILKSTKNKINNEVYNDLKQSFKDYIKDEEFKKVIYGNFNNVKYDWAKHIIKKKNGKNITLGDIEKYIHDKQITMLDEYKSEFGELDVEGNLEQMERQFNRYMFKVTSSKVHAGFTEELESTPNILGKKEIIDEDIVLDNLSCAVGLLHLYLNKIIYIIGYNNSK